MLINILGVAGNIHDPKGKRFLYYAWGLGNVFNNLVKAYSLWMGMCFANELGINDIVVLGDSMLVIKSMVNHVDMESNALSYVLSRIICMVTRFWELSFFHIESSIARRTIGIK